MVSTLEDMVLAKMSVMPIKRKDIIVLPEILRDKLHSLMWTLSKANQMILFGDVRRYYRNGNLLSVGKYLTKFAKDDRKYGKHIKWYNNGNIKSVAMYEVYDRPDNVYSVCVHKQQWTKDGVESRFENFKVKLVNECITKVRHGLCKIYENGKLAHEGVWKDGEEVGLHTTFWHNGNIKERFEKGNCIYKFAENGTLMYKLIGEKDKEYLELSYWDNGNIHEKTKGNGNTRVELTFSYTGVLMSELTITGDITHHRYYTGGRLIREKTTKDAKLHGDHIVYDEDSIHLTPYFNGQKHGIEYKQVNDQRIFEIPWVNGKKHGIERHWHNGELSEVIEFADDVRNGKYMQIIEWRTLTGSYKNGVHHGVWLSKYRTGQPMCQWELDNGIATGEGILYDNDGQVVLRYKWEKSDGLVKLVPM